MSGRALLYGASGYTGRLIAQHLGRSIDLVLAGRDEARVRAVAEPLGLAWRAFGLTSPTTLAAALRDVDVVLHAAGPFAATALPMAEACLKTGTHYLDLSGEWPAFLALTELDDAAKAAGIMVLPGIGLTVATTDCLLARAVELWPDTVRLCLGISRPQIISRGSVATMTSMFAPDVPIRRGGRLVTVPAGSLVHAFDFGHGLRETVAVCWADVVTAGITTGVGDVEVYSQLHWAERAMFRAGGISMSMFGPEIMRELGGAMARTLPNDPNAEQRAGAHYSMVVEALDPWRRVRRLSMTTRDGYSASVLTAAEGLRRVLHGDAPAGFQTPSRAFGSDFAIVAGAASFAAAGARTAA